MKNGFLTISILVYCFFSILYIALVPDIAKSSQPDFQVWVRCFYYILQYGLMFTFTCELLKKVNYSTDILSLTVFKYYVLFKLVFFTFLINVDLPTYISWLDSKPISILLSITTLALSIALTLLRK